MPFKSTLLLAMLHALGTPPTEASEDVEARWRREYPRAAAVLEKTARSFLAKGKFSHRIPHGGDETYTTENLTVASSGDKKLFIRDQRFLDQPNHPRKPLGSDVWCKTPDYVFVLNKETPKDPYIIIYNSIKFKRDTDFYINYSSYCGSETTYMQKSLIERMQSPSFVLRAAESLQDEDGDGELVRIDYSYDHDDAPASESGSVYLDPQRNWAIRRVDILNTATMVTGKEDTLKVDIEIDYQQVGDGVFFPRRVEGYYKTKYPDGYQHDILELSQIQVGDVPDKIFKLSAYGLPDVPLKPKKAESSLFSLRNPLFWVALVVAVVSFTLLRLTRSRKDTEPKVA